jgi:hypothetical protein
MKTATLLLVSLLLLVMQAKAQIQSDTSDALWSIVMPEAKSDNIDLKKCLVGTYKDSVVNEFIINIGSYPFRVVTIYFEGNDARCFSLVSGLPQYTIAAGNSHFAEFRFTPARVGLHNAYVVTITQADTIKYKIKGEGVLPKLNVMNSIIDFGVVELGSYKDTLQAVTIKNIGDAPLLITNTKHNKPNDKDFTSLAGGGSFTLQPGDIRRMDLRFTPTNPGRTNGTLEFYYNGEGSPAVVQLFGEAPYCIKNISASFHPSEKEMSFDSVHINDIICKQLILKNLTEDELIYDSIFIFNNFEYSIPQSQLPLKIAPNDSVALNVCFAPLFLGSRKDTIVLFNNCGCQIIPLNGTSIPNIYSGTSKCNANIELTTEKLQNIIIMPPFPNPFHDKMSIIYRIKEAGEVSFDFYNIYGEKFCSVSKQHQSTGNFSFDFVAPSDMMPGIYYCVARKDNSSVIFNFIYLK